MGQCALGKTVFQPYKRQQFQQNRKIGKNKVNQQNSLNSVIENVIPQYSNDNKTIVPFQARQLRLNSGINVYQTHDVQSTFFDQVYCQGPVIQRIMKERSQMKQNIGSQTQTKNMKKKKIFNFEETKMMPQINEQINEQKEFIEQNQQNNFSIECQICFRPYTKELLPIMICIYQHTFCKQCVSTFFGVCPLDRQQFDEKKVFTNRLLLKTLNIK